MPRGLKISDLGRVLSLYPRAIRGAMIGPQAQIAGLVDLGILRPTGTVISRFCDRCDRQHFAEIVTSPEGQGWYCPDDGFVVAEPSDIAAYGVRIDAFVDLLAALMDRQRRWARPRGAPMLWSVGSIGLSDLQIAIYFAIDAGALRDFNEMLPILRSEPRADAIAVLTADTRDLSNLVLPQVGRIVSIADCLSVGSEKHLELNRNWLARRVLPEHLLTPSRPGRKPSAQHLADETIREISRVRDLAALSQNERHRVLKAAAKSKYGPGTTLSKSPCNIAWDAYVVSERAKRST